MVSLTLALPTEHERRHMDMASFPAAILFVDISGFTSLNEKFAKEGSGGIEKVTRHINGYFSQLIEMIYKYGGDILKFAGDALIVSFGDRRRLLSLKENILRATLCGMEIQKELRSYDADGIRLTLHIAVGAGNLYTFHLGGIEKHWEYFPAGSLFGQISTALDKSQSGEVYLSAPAYEEIKEECEAKENAGDYLVLSVSTPVGAVESPSLRASSPSLSAPGEAAAVAKTFEEDIRCYIGSGILSKIDAGQAQYLAEMRRVSVIFVSLKGLSFQKLAKALSQQEAASAQEEKSAESAADTAAADAAAKDETSAESDTTEEQNEANSESPSTDTESERSDTAPSLASTSAPTKRSPLAMKHLDFHRRVESVPSLNVAHSHHRIASEDYSNSNTPRVLGGKGDTESDAEEPAPQGKQQQREIVPDYHELHQVLRVMQKVIYRHDGFVRQFLVDDKGCTLIAVFGAPTSHADDPIRAVAAALSIKNQLKGLNLKTYIGVTTGTAFCGTVGSSTRQEYAVVGDIVNLSARLMVASYKGRHGILCDSATNEVAGERFNMRALAPISVKGKSDLISIFIPTRESLKKGQSIRISMAEGRLERISLYGRDAEKSLLYESIANLSTDNSVGIVCEGIAGIGKTRLAQELVTMARSKFGDESVVFGSGDSIDQATSFLVFAFVLNGLYGLKEDVKANETTLKNAFASIKDIQKRNDCFSNACFLNEILVTEFPQTAAANKIAGDEKEKVKMLHMIIRELVVLAAQTTPRVIVIEDAQWLDIPSVSLITDLTSTTHSILLLVTSRVLPASAMKPQYAEFRSSVNATVLTLQPLTADAIISIVQLAYSIHRTKPIPTEFATLLTQKAQGNPFFAKEIVKGLMAQGAIQIEGGRVEILKDLTSVVIPQNLTSLIMSNYDQLNPRQQMVLKVASVLGKVVSVDVLEAVFPQAAKKGLNIQDELTKLVAAGILAVNDQTLKRSYVFTSQLFAEVAYGMMLEGHRHELHEATGAYYESEFIRTDSLNPVINQLIYHFERAGKQEKADVYRERMVARRHWQYAYRLVSTVEFWGRKGAPVQSKIDNEVVNDLVGVTPVSKTLSKFPATREQAAEATSKK